MEHDLDALGLLASRRSYSIQFGEVEVGTAMRRSHMTRAMNKMPDAELTLQLDRMPMPFDYFSGVTVTRRDGEQQTPQFSGSAVTGSVVGGGVTVEALGAPSMAERLTGHIVTRAVPDPEVVHLLARAGGLREEQIVIPELAGLPLETFEVLAPLEGVSIEKAVDFAGITILPASAGTCGLATLDVSDELHDEFAASGYALALVTTTRCLEAEERGLEAIDLALAWLTLRLRYGLVILPDERPLPFQRSESLARPTRRDMVMVRGLTTTRQWLRQPRSLEIARTVDPTPDGLRMDGNMPQLPLQERLAVLALARATQEPDELARVHALFEAIEFYAAGVKVKQLFPKASLKEIRNGLPASLTAQQRGRIGDLLGGANAAPLRIRLVQALDEDGVPITADEVDLLWRLRQLRNDVVHGRKSELPVREDVEYATSIVARMLMYRTVKPRRIVSG